MFGMSLGELALIGVVILIVFGPQRLPEIAKQLGKVAGDLRKVSDGFRKEFYNAVYKPTDFTQSIQRELKAVINEPPPEKKDPQAKNSNVESSEEEKPNE